MPDARVAWGQSLERRRLQLEITQVALAGRMRVDASAVRNWIAGKNACTRLNMLANILFPNTTANDPDRLDFIAKHDAAFFGVGGIDNPPPPPPPPPPSNGSFRLGGIEASMLVLDHCRTGYSHREFHSWLVPWVEPEVPPAWSERWQQVLAKAGELRAKRQINNNPILALREIGARREGSGEPSGFNLGFAPTTYVPKRAATIFFNEFATERERAELLADVRGWQLHPLLSRCLNTQTAIITSDGKFMFARRSEKLINPGRTVCGVAETMEESDAISLDGESGPDVFKTVFRGLEQEFGIEMAAAPDNRYDIIKLVSLIFDMDYYEPIFTGVADFRKASNFLRSKTTARAIEDGLRTGRAKDLYENKDVIFVDLALQPIFEFFAKNKLTNYATVCLVQALQFAQFSDDRIIDAHRRAKS